MLLRKRAWDIMREEFAFVREDASLAEAVGVLRELRGKQPDASFILVFDKNDKFLGILSMWNLIQSIGTMIMADRTPQRVVDPLTGNEVDWDRAFSQACRSCANVRIADSLQLDVPVLKPNDPLARVLEVFLDYRRGRAVVEEGGRIIGVVCVADLFKEISDSLMP